MDTEVMLAMEATPVDPATLMAMEASALPTVAMASAEDTISELLTAVMADTVATDIKFHLYNIISSNKLFI